MEVIVFVVIVSVALVGVLASLSQSAKHSADPLLPKKALAIAEGLLEEITLKEYSDPDGTGGETRANFDDVQDFGAAGEASTTIDTDLLGNPYEYPAVVTITSTTLGPAAVAAYRIDVAVNYGQGSISLTGYRTNY